MRMVEAVEGGASRREVAELYGISPSVVVIWMQHGDRKRRSKAERTSVTAKLSKPGMPSDRLFSTIPVEVSH